MQTTFVVIGALQSEHAIGNCLYGPAYMGNLTRYFAVRETNGKGSKRILNISQHAPDVKTKTYQRRCNAMTSIDVDTALLNAPTHVQIIMLVFSDENVLKYDM